MTELLVARVDSVVKGTDGVMHRLHRGKTIAEKGHPVVEAAPQAFVPFTVHLPAPGGGEGGSAEPVDVTELRIQLDDAYSILTTISDGLEVRGLLEGVDTSEQGWLVKAVVAALDRRAIEQPAVTPPRGAKPRKVAAPRVTRDAP